MCSQSLVREVEAENSALQLRLKRLNEEFRTRLVCYIQDLAVSVQRSLEHTPASAKTILQYHVFITIETLFSFHFDLY